MVQMGMESALPDMHQFKHSSSYGRSFLLPKHFPLRPILNQGILKVLENGLSPFQGEEENMLYMGASREAASRALELNQLVTVFLLLVSGVILSFSISVYEFLRG